MAFNEAYTINPKLVFRASARTKLTLSTIYNLSQSQGYNDSKRFAPDGRNINDAYAITNIATFKQTLSSTAVLNMRASYKLQRRNSAAFDDFNDPRYQYSSDSDPTTGFFLGGTENGRSRFEEDQIFLSGDLTWQVNFSNEIKTGFQFRTNRFKSIDSSIDFFDARVPAENRRRVDVIRPTDVNPFFDLYLEDVRALQDSVLVRTLATDLSGESRIFEQQPIEFAAFVQDKLEFGNNLVVKAGLRFEYYDTRERYIINTRAQSEVIGDETNLDDVDPKTYLSPRIGISFPISETGAFRVAYGHFTQMPAYSRLYQNPVDANTTQLQLEGRTVGNPNLIPERTIKYEVGLQQQISDFIGIDVNLFYKNIRNLLGVQVLATQDGVNYFRTVNRDYGLIKGGTISFFTNPKGYLNAAGFDITYQDAQSSSSNPNAIADVLIAGRRGEEPDVVVDRNIIPLDWDQPLTANAYLVFGKPNNWNVSVIHQLATGQPFTPVFLDENKDFPENFFDNSENKPTLITLDLSAEKQFNIRTTDVTFRVQVNNLFNYLNERTVDSVSGRADQIVRIPEAQSVRNQVNEVVGLFTNQQDDNRPTWYSAPREILFSIQFNF
jgi:outer membrane receptor protein involved in Fe transport